MASPAEEADRIAAAAAAAAAATVDDDSTYDPLVDGELEPELNSDFLVNPDIPTSSKQLKKEKEVAAEERKENEHYGRTKNNLKTTLVFSGVVVAVVGAIFAVLKKIKEA